MSIQIGRLGLDDPEQFTEALGDQYANTAGAPIPGNRQGLIHQLQLTSFTSQQGDTTQMRINARNQLRSLLNNTPYCLTAPIFTWTDDPGNSLMFCVPGTATSDPYDTAGLQFGLWQIKTFYVNQVGHTRTHRRAFEIYVRDRRLSTTPLDILRRLYNSTSDFSTLTPVSVVWLPAGATDAITNASTSTPVTGTTVSGMAGGNATPVFGLPDLAVASIEQTQSYFGLGDVVVHDRMGQMTAPVGGPDTQWVEVYGPDWPWYAMSADTPVIENGYCRVRLNTTGTIGFAVDAYNSGTGQWVEQGKAVINRLNAGTNYYDTTLVSSGIKEWTQERGVIEAVFSNNSDSTARESVYITLQRGWRGPKFEVYLSNVAAGTTAGGGILWTPAAVDANIAVAKIDASDVGNYVSAWTTGSTPTNFAGTLTTLGASTFTGQNWVHMLRPTGSGTTQGVSFAVVQAAAVAQTINSSLAYGNATNAVQLQIPAGGTGIFVCQMALCPTNAAQAQNAATMTLGSGTSTGSDSASYSGTTTTTTRTSSAVHVSSLTWPGSAVGTFRVFARVKTSASTANVLAATGAGQGQVNGSARTATTTSTSYVWLDLGVVTATGTLAINAWASSAATVSVDRIEAVWVSDTTSGAFSGAQDLGQATLYDTRQTANVVARQ